MPRPARLRILLLLPALLVLAACQTTGNGRPTHMTSEELANLIRIGTAPVILDVRSTREFRNGHIPGAIHMPFWQTFYRAGKLAVPRHKTVVVTCAHGPRAGIGRFALQRAGFENVVYLEGHMSGWYKSGLPVVAGTE
jgi:hydroxyacylglutathione hydrolase